MLPYFSYISDFIHPYARKMGSKITIFHIYNAKELLRVIHITLGVSNQVKKENISLWIYMTELQNTMGQN